MHKINFLRVKYREKNKNRILKSSVIIFSIINILLLINIFCYKKKIEATTGWIEQNKSCFSVKQNSNDNRKNNVEYIDNFRDFYNFVKNEIIISNISINEKQIQFCGDASNIMEYIHFLEKLEKEKEYKIKDFSNINKDEKEINFNIKMEVK